MIYTYSLGNTTRYLNAGGSPDVASSAERGEGDGQGSIGVKS